MKKVNNDQLSKNFWLYEFLRSNTASKLGGEVLEEQFSPNEEIIANIKHHVKTTLQKARDFFGVGISLNSGLRMPKLNEAVGGSPTSQHCLGEASDKELANELFNPDNKKAAAAKKTIESLVQSITGKPLRKGCNANFYLFAYLCIFRYELDIDQVIHEYGHDGAPDWIHSASSLRRNKREILIKRSGEGYIKLNLKQALLLGC